MAVAAQGENPMSGMKELEREDASPEGAVPEMVLSMGIGSDASADRNQGVAGLRGQIPAVRRGHRVKLTER
ncbi:MAG: hypothetical protein WCC53_05200 [Thermoanaerobaculia bacterium]